MAKYIYCVIAGIVLGIYFGMIIDLASSIKILDHQGKVIAIKEVNNTYDVTISVEAYHNGLHKNIHLVTPNNYTVGDIIKFE